LPDSDAIPEPNGVMKLKKKCCRSRRPCKRCPLAQAVARKRKK
jgi:hypothetical protein